MEFYRWNEQSAVKPEVKIEEGSNKYEEDKKDGIFQVVAAPESILMNQQIGSARYIAYGTQNGVIGIIDMLNWDNPGVTECNLIQHVRGFGTEDTLVRCIKFSRDGNQLFVAVAKGVLRINRANIEDYDWLCKSKVPVTHICVGEEGLVYTLDRESIKCWETFNFGLDWTIKEIFNPQAPKARTCLQDYDKWLISGKMDGNIELWDISEVHHAGPTHRTLMGEANRSTRSLAICEDKICAVTDNGKLLELSYARNQNMQISKKSVTGDNYVGCFYSPIIRRAVDITHGVPVVMIYGDCIAVYNPQSELFFSTVHVPNGNEVHRAVRCFTHTTSYIYCGTLDGRIIEVNIGANNLEFMTVRNVGGSTITSLACWVMPLENR